MSPMSMSSTSARSVIPMATLDAVDENSAAGTSVGVTAFATDGDGSNNTVTYSLTDTAGGLFTIDTNTGIVTTTAALDAETAVSYDITVRADSTDGQLRDPHLYHRRQ